LLPRACDRWSRRTTRSASRSARTVSASAPARGIRWRWTWTCRPACRRTSCSTAPPPGFSIRSAPRGSARSRGSTSTSRRTRRPRSRSACGTASRSSSGSTPAGCIRRVMFSSCPPTASG